MPGKLSPKVTKLEKQIRSLNSSLLRLRNRDLIELLLIIRRPGWTTPAEFRYATGIVESLLMQVKAIESLKATLLQGSRSVGRG